MVGDLNVDVILTGMTEFPKLGREIHCEDVQVVMGGSSSIFACRLTQLGASVVVNVGFEKMKATPQVVTVSLDLYFKGTSLRKIVDHLEQFHNVKVTHVAVFKWIKKYVQLMKDYVDSLVPKVSGIWHSDEMTLSVDGDLKWLWNVIDNESRFWLASQITEQRQTVDARTVPAEARNMAKVRPMAMVTDGLRAYEHAITKEFYAMKAPRTEHIRVPNIRNRSNNNMVERLNGTVREKQSDKRPRSRKNRTNNNRRIQNLLQLHKTPHESRRKNTSRSVRIRP